MRLRTRLLLILELLVGLLPVTISYLYHFLVGVFWTGQVIELAGGNALVDGPGTVFSTCVMLKENREWFGLSEQEFREVVETRLGLDNYG